MRDRGDKTHELRRCIPDKKDNRHIHTRKGICRQALDGRGIGRKISDQPRRTVQELRILDQGQRTQGQWTQDLEPRMVDPGLQWTQGPRTEDQQDSGPRTVDRGPRTVDPRTQDRGPRTVDPRT
ncbi:hypothetical protein ACROYT_G006220 [Oculina patagonica]